MKAEESLVRSNSIPGSRTHESIGASWRAFLRQRWDKLIIPVVLALFVAMWNGVVRWQAYPAFILPSPAVVARKARILMSDGTLLRHAQVTLAEVALGLAIGLTLAFILGYILGKSRLMDRLLSPYIVSSQTVPVVAIAPLLIIWFGSGMTSKVLICALITFFPTLISTSVGIRTVDGDLHDLMRSLGAGRWQIFTKLELPASLPVIFGGLKLSVILSVVGAVVGEFVGANAGLGFLINLARGVLDTPMMFVAVISLVVIAQLLYGIVSLAEGYLLRWQRTS